MPDLGKTQAEWTAFWREFTQYLRLHKMTEGIRKRFLGSNIKILELNEGAGVVSNWSFSGAIRGINSDEGGRLYINLNDENPGAGQAQVQVYSDSGKTALVAQGDAADNNTITLAEQNNSGLSGTVDIGVVAASDTDIVLLLDIDEEQKAKDIFGTSDGSNAARRGHIDRLRLFESTLRSLANGNRSDLERNFLRTKLAEFMSSATQSAVSVVEETDDNGDVQITYTGLLPELSDAMADNTPTAQTIERNVVAAAAAVFDGDNVGSGSVVHISQQEHALAGTVTFRCTSGKADTLEETFDVTIVDSNGNAISATLDLQVKKIWESALFGIRLRLDRTITDVEPVGPDQLNTWVINGETLDNTDVGVLYAELTDVAGTRTVKLYANAAKTNLVAQGSRVGDGVITLAEQSNSGLTGSVNVTYTGDDLGITVDLNAFAEGDVFTVVVTNDEAGRIQTILKELWGFSINSAVAASETIPDLMLEEAADHIIAVS